MSSFNDLTSCLRVSTSECVLDMPALISCSLSNPDDISPSILVTSPCSPSSPAACCLLDPRNPLWMMDRPSVALDWFERLTASCSLKALIVFPNSWFWRSRFSLRALSILLRRSWRCISIWSNLSPSRSSMPSVLEQSWCGWSLGGGAEADSIDDEPRWGLLPL